MKLLIFALLISIALAGNPVMKDSNQAMADAKDWQEKVAVHLAAQKKFHGSEFEIFQSRRKFLETQLKDFEAAETCWAAFRKVMSSRRAERQEEKKITTVTNANKAARNGPLAEKRAAWKKFARGRYLEETNDNGVPLDGKDRESPEMPACEDKPEKSKKCCEAFRNYYELRSKSVTLQLKFHNKEFAEFKNEEDCIAEFNKNVEAGQKVRDVKKAQRACTKKGKLTKAEINAANNARKVGDRNSINALRVFGKEAKESRSRGKGKRRRMLKH